MASVAAERDIDPQMVGRCLAQLAFQAGEEVRRRAFDVAGENMGERFGLQITEEFVIALVGEQCRDFRDWVIGIDVGKTVERILPGVWMRHADPHACDTPYPLRLRQRVR
ncbi:hypothetical protein ACH4LN_02045 [Streptomyces albus]|uniref:hypothetical protein n=1 Tax=Streptomyces TaxID=1883 RepID=UPI001F40FC26|nr:MULTISPECIES: hypothetical protein [Streptomyces]